MTFTPLEAIGLASFFSVVTGTVVKIWDGTKVEKALDAASDCVKHEELDELKEEWDRRCREKQELCAGHQLLGELRGIKALLQILCEKAEITARQQQEIVRDAK